MAPRDSRSNRSNPKGSTGSLGREVTVSKSLSWILRHGAEKERIAMDGHGYVKVDELLHWHKLRSMGVRMDELVGVVEGNEKKRFGLRWVGSGGGEDATETPAEATRTEDDVEQNTDGGGGGPAEEETETQRALQHVAAGDLEPRHYLIRATQGHSLKTIEATAYLTPITLADPKSLPETVVHGTFYGAWERILASGGLKSMGRVHVHFATGPKKEDVLERVKGGTDGDGGSGEKAGGGGSPVGDVVISGMRSDAQILIYVDIRRALKAGVEFWRSENRVVLTEGIAIGEEEGGGGGGEEGGKMLSSEFWDEVVEVKAGLGVLWKHDEGVVRELPKDLKGRGMPRGKDRSGGSDRAGRHDGRGRANNAKPRLKVERDDAEVG
jgi:RNA:NAD 2'-phosphotransferase (TPT1/KptA family)